ncbi:MAG TPA: PrgI family protein [Candidatus Paceibacterota bacterium]
MQYQTPQFIDVEDKIFGPLTAKQFFYLLGGVAAIFILYVFFQLWVVILLGLPIGGFSLALTFLKINGIPFTKVLANFLSHTSQQKVFIWQRESKPRRSEEVGAPTPKGVGVAPKLTESKLQELAWSLDIKQKTRK